MSDYRDALEKIMVLCGQSRMYSRRTQIIHDTAMKALGMTANQRNERHIKIMERIENHPEGQYLERLKMRERGLT